MNWFLYDRDLRHERIKSRFKSKRMMNDLKNVSNPSRHLHVRRRSGVFIVNFGHISHLALVFHTLFFIANFEHVNADWDGSNSY